MVQHLSLLNNPREPRAVRNELVEVSACVIVVVGNALRSIAVVQQAPRLDRRVVDEAPHLTNLLIYRGAKRQAHLNGGKALCVGEQLVLSISRNVDEASMPVRRRCDLNGDSAAYDLLK